MTSPYETLALAALRRWCYDRAAMRRGAGTRYQSRGWRARRQRDCDARLVRALAFERALSVLDPEHQLALICTYRDGLSWEETARAIGCSARNVGYILPAARRRLADILDRLDLL